MGAKCRLSRAMKTQQVSLDQIQLDLIYDIVTDKPNSNKRGFQHFILPSYFLSLGYNNPNRFAINISVHSHAIIYFSFIR